MFNNFFISDCSNKVNLIPITADTDNVELSEISSLLIFSKYADLLNVDNVVNNSVINFGKLVKGIGDYISEDVEVKVANGVRRVVQKTSTINFTITDVCPNVQFIFETVQKNLDLYRFMFYTASGRLYGTKGIKLSNLNINLNLKRGKNIVEYNIKLEFVSNTLPDYIKDTTLLNRLELIKESGNVFGFSSTNVFGFSSVNTFG